MSEDHCITLIDYPSDAYIPANPLDGRIIIVNKSLDTSDVNGPTCEQMCLTKCENRNHSIYHVELCISLMCTGSPESCPFNHEAVDDGTRSQEWKHLHRGVISSNTHFRGKIHYVSYVAYRSRLGAMFKCCAAPDADAGFKYTVGGMYKYVDRTYSVGERTSGAKETYQFPQLATPESREVYTRVYRALITFLDNNVHEAPGAREDTKMCCAPGYNYLGAMWMAFSTILICMPRTIRRMCTCGARLRSRGDTSPYIRRDWFCSEAVAAALAAAGILWDEDDENAVHPAQMTPRDIIDRLNARKLLTHSSLPPAVDRRGSARESAG